MRQPAGAAAYDTRNCGWCESEGASGVGRVMLLRTRGKDDKRRGVVKWLVDGYAHGWRKGLLDSPTVL